MSRGVQADDFHDHRQVMEGMAEWRNRPLDRVYPVLFVDAISVEIRDGQVANRPIHGVMAVTAQGTRDILGIWAGDGVEGAKCWLHVFTGLENRGLDDVLMLVCGGLKGLPEAVETVWPRTIVQTCVVHLLRNSFRYGSPSGLGRGPRSPQAHLHGSRRGRDDGAVPGVPGGMGPEVSGGREDVVGRLGRVRAPPLLRRRDPQGHLQHEHDRERQRADTQGRPRPRTPPPTSPPPSSTSTWR
jgi:putative transposase